ncbi:MAG: hypothetical protein AAF541_13435 [Pseudomonadota bacterium]
MLERLAQTPTLWVAFIITVLITAAFPVASSMWGISFIDAISEPGEVRQAVAALTPDQKVIHAWITATLDVAYPLAYGALFAGSAYRFFPKIGKALALTILVVVPADLLEGVVQVLALTDTVDLLAAKAVLTPLKTLLFLLGFAATVIGWVTWLIGRVRG